MKGKAWPESVRKAAKDMRFQGLSYGTISKQLAPIAGREISPRTIQNWMADLPSHWSEMARWPDKWKRRARELVSHDGCPIGRAAAIIEIESGRACNPVTAYRWIYPERAIQWTRRSRSKRSIG
jgi:hypothetical protein